ncbi:MAG: type II methionyl aminopeptidase [Candidatus Micrarchaeota archaeon]
MDSTELENFIQAGKIAGKIREDSKKLIMVGEPLLEIAENIESMILEEGAKPGFPVNISINNIAAHYTPEFDCTLALDENDMVKIDIGVSVDGAIGDTAYTIDLSGKNENLINASREALDAALKFAKAGVTNGQIGEIIEEKIRSFGVKPISNLSGHSISTGDLHAGVNIPNVKTGEKYKLKEGEIFAIEPFTTNGKGYVEDAEQVEIFSIVSDNPVRMRQSRQILNFVKDNYTTLPFAERWVRKEFSSKLLVTSALKELLSMQVVRGYPVLKETGGGLVAQFEHTILVEENGVRILTK